MKKLLLCLIVCGCAVDAEPADPVHDRGSLGEVRDFAPGDPEAPDAGMPEPDARVCAAVLTRTCEGAVIQICVPKGGCAEVTCGSQVWQFCDGGP